MERSFQTWPAFAFFLALACACQSGGFSGSAPGGKKERADPEEDDGDSEDARADEPTMVTGMFLVCGPDTDTGGVQYANAATYGCAAIDPRTKRRADAARVDGVEAVLEGGTAVRPPVLVPPPGSFWHVVFTLAKSAKLAGVVATAHVGAQSGQVAAADVTFAVPVDPSGSELGSVVVPESVASAASSTVVTPPEAAKQRLFVTSSAIMGDFGGRAAADKVCQERAYAAGMNAQVVALLADLTSLPQVQVPGALYNTRNEVLSPKGLFGAVLGAGLYDEAGQPLSGPEPLVWTGTSPTGDYKDPEGVGNCAGWREKGGKLEAIIGNPQVLTEGRWLSDGVIACDEPAHLYCISLP